MSMIGFDIGNDSCVIAAANSRGDVDVLLSNQTKREIPAVVSFDKKQRLLGCAATASDTSSRKPTISQIKRLIGKLYKEVEEDLKLLPFVTNEGPRGGILIELDYLKQKWAFTPVEILGMLFNHLKQVAEKELKSSVVDCVIGIPSYFTDLQRRLYLDAAHIAGLNPLRLMHDGTATALGYGMRKTDLPNNVSPVHVMFVDIGHCDTQVTVAAFEPGGLKILSHSFDQSLGGRDFDEVLCKHFAAEFSEVYKIDVYSNDRAAVRLRASCEGVKRVLSANEEAEIVIECLLGDTIVRGLVTRKVFEDLSSKLLERIEVTCKMALQDSGLTVDELYTIELVGSGSRIPAITKILTSFYQKEPTRTLNASECVATGCALHCAMLSPTPDVRDYMIRESFPYSVVIPSPQGEFTVFPKGNHFPTMEMKHFRSTPLFYLQVAYLKEREFPAGISNIVGHFGIGSSEPLVAENVEVQLRVKLDSHGIFEVASVTLSEGKRHDTCQMMLMDDTPILNLSTTGNVNVSTTIAELNEAKDKEHKLKQQDMKEEESNVQRNSLESFVYATRSKLSGVYGSFATASEKEKLTKNLQDAEAWLYEDNADEIEVDYAGTLNNLEKLLLPIINRYKEQEEAIAKARGTLQACVAEYRSHADNLSADEKNYVKDVCTQAELQVSGLPEKQLPPKTLLAEINQAINFVERRCKVMISSKSYSPRHEEHQAVESDHHVTSENLMAEVAKPLQACLAKNYTLAESLPDDKKEKVIDVCLRAEKWLRSRFQNHASPKALITDFKRAVEIVERKCDAIVGAKPSSSKHETIESDQRNKPVDIDQWDTHNEFQVQK